MKKIHQGTAALGLAATMLLASASSFAHEGTVRYWGDSNGNIWRDSWGECWRTSEWTAPTPDNYVEGCDPEMKAEVKAPPPAPQPVVHEVTISARALFDFDKATLRPDAQQVIDDLVAKIKSLSQVDKIIVRGHTDSIGTEAYNMKLSQRRADAVKQALVAAGIDESIIVTEAYGESQPVASNKTREGRQQNRRVEIEVIGLAQE